MDSSFSMVNWIIVLLVLAALVFAVLLFVRRRGERNAKARSNFWKGLGAGCCLAILSNGPQFVNAKVSPTINLGFVLDVLVQGLMLGVLIGGVSAGVALRRSNERR
jgi:hypothetical protein